MEISSVPWDEEFYVDHPLDVGNEDVRLRWKV